MDLCEMILYTEVSSTEATPKESGVNGAKKDL